MGWLGNGLVRRGARDSLNIRFETALSARLKPKEAEDIVSFFKQLLAGSRAPSRTRRHTSSCLSHSRLTSHTFLLIGDTCDLVTPSNEPANYEDAHLFAFHFHIPDYMCGESKGVIILAHRTLLTLHLQSPQLHLPEQGWNCRP